MAEEYDPLDKLGTGNAYDALVAGRTNKLKKAAAAGSIPVGIIIVVVLRVVLAGVNSSGGSHSPPPEMPDFQREINGLELGRNRLREHLGELERNRQTATGILQKRLDEEKQRLVLFPPRDDVERRQRLASIEKLETQLMILEVNRWNGQENRVPGDAGGNFPGPAKELPE